MFFSPNLASISQSLPNFVSFGLWQVPPVCAQCSPFRITIVSMQSVLRFQNAALVQRHVYSKQGFYYVFQWGTFLLNVIDKQINSASAHCLALHTFPLHCTSSPLGFGFKGLFIREDCYGCFWSR